MSREFEGFNNDFFDFENTDNFLDSISGTGVGNDVQGYNGWNYDGAGDNIQFEQQIDRGIEQARNHSLFSYNSSDSNSKGEDLTPDSQPTFSSSHTTPEPSKSISSESEDERPRKRVVLLRIR